MRGLGVLWRSRGLSIYARGSVIEIIIAPIRAVWLLLIDQNILDLSRHIEKVDEEIHT